MDGKKNIIIAGAGIGGLSAAILLRKAGFPVMVFEKRDDCGIRFHGDWQGIENWNSKGDIINNLKMLGIDITDVIIPVNYFTAISYKKSFQLNFSRPAVYLVKRGRGKGTLDYKLKSIAKECGVNIYFNTPVKCMEKVDIIATGPNPKDSIYVAKGINFTTDCNDTTAIYLNTKCFLYGYAYFLAREGRATIALCGMKNTFNAREAALIDVITFFRSKFGSFEIRNKKYFGGYGITPLSSGFSDVGALIIGEAAGLQDNFFGFGIKYAFKSAIAASEHIAYGMPYHIFFKNELARSVIATRVWGRITFSLFKNPGIHSVCSAAEKNSSSVLKFFYRPTIFTRIAGSILR